MKKYMGKINVVGKWDGVTIYRYLSIERFLELIETKINTLVHISKWEDPNEAYLIRARIAEGRSNGDSEDIRGWYDRYRAFYGQSWMSNGKESDVLWRAYGKRGDTIRIETTIRGITNTLEEYVKSERRYDLNAYIGVISYVKDLNDVLPFDNHEIIKTLFVKREEFMDENEFRVVVQVGDGEEPNDAETKISIMGGLFRYGVDVSDLIKGVLVDPCCTSSKFDEIQCRALNAGLDIEIKKSNLFERPMSRQASSVSMQNEVIGFMRQDKVTDQDVAEVRFWRIFQRTYHNGNSEFTGRRPPNRRYWGIPMGKGLSYFVVFNRDFAKAELYIDSPDKTWNKTQFDAIEEHLKHNYPDSKVEPQRLDGRASRIALFERNFKFSNTDQWDDAVKWLCQALDQIRAMTKDFIDNLE